MDDGRPRVVSTLFAALLAGVLAVGVAVADEAADVGAARRLLDAGRAAEAAEALERSLERMTAAGADAAAVADVEALLGRALGATGASEEALTHLENALRAREKGEDRILFAETLLAIARSNLEAPNPSSLSVTPYLADAIASAERVEAPDLLGRRERVIAEALAWRGDDAAAVEHWSKAGLDALPPEGARVPLSRMALSLYRLGRFADAAAAWHRAGDRLGEASAWAAAREGPKSVALYADLLRERPGDEALLEQALAAARFTNARPALAAALASLRADGAAQARILRVRGVLAEESGDAGAAQGLLREAAQRDTTWPKPLVDLGRVLVLGGGGAPSEEARGGAVDAWLEAMRRDPADETVKRLVWDQAGIDYADGTRAGGSAAALERSLRAQRTLAETYPDDAEAWANLANSLRTAGKTEEAVAAYRRALAINPESASIQSDAGLAEAAAGHVREALEAFERAVALDPTFTSPRQNAARFRWVAGDDDAAEAHLAAALRAARSEGKGEMLFRFLLDRTWRTRRRPELR